MFQRKQDSVTTALCEVGFSVTRLETDQHTKEILKRAEIHSKIGGRTLGAVFAYNIRTTYKNYGEKILWKWPI